MPPQYKFVEVAPVTEESLEAAVNEWVGKGWQLDGIRFVTTEHSKRPQLAFVSFVGGPEGAPQVEAAPAEAGGQAKAEAPRAEPDGLPRVITAPHGTDVD